MSGGGRHVRDFGPLTVRPSLLPADSGSRAWGRACRRHFRPSLRGWLYPKHGPGHSRQLLQASPRRVAVKVVIRKASRPTRGGRMPTVTASPSRTGGPLTGVSRTGGMALRGRQSKTLGITPTVWRVANSLKPASWNGSPTEQEVVDSPRPPEARLQPTGNRE